MTFVDGQTGEGVRGLTVTADGQVATTDEEGRVVAMVREGTALGTAGDRAHFDRRTRFEGAVGDRFTLWPLEPRRLDSEYFRHLVYVSTSSGGGEGPLTRPTAGTYTMSAAPALRGDRDAMLWLEMSGRRAALAASDQVHFVWKDAGGDVTFEVDAADPNFSGNAIGLAYVRRNGHTIVGARLVFRDLKWVTTSVPMHEIGHFLGLQHSVEGRDIMTGSYGYDGWDFFTDGETLAMTLMFQRAPGNTYPDTAPGVGAQSAGQNEALVVCGGS